MRFLSSRVLRFSRRAVTSSLIVFGESFTFSSNTDEGAESEDAVCKIATTKEERFAYIEQALSWSKKTKQMVLGTSERENDLAKYVFMFGLSPL